MVDAHALLLAIALVTQLVTLVGGEVLCPYEICDCTPELIDCTSKKLVALPPLKKGNFTQTQLDIKWNAITSIEFGQLPRNLQVLTSHGITPLTFIFRHALNESYNTLHTLDVSFTRMNHLPLELAHLPHLTSLTWSGNPMTSWDLLVLVTLGASVESLVLDHVGMTDIPAWLKFFSKLTTFSFQHNNVVKLDFGRNSYPNLGSIDLSYNGLSDVDGLSTLGDFTHPFKIVMTSNHLRNINFLVHLHNISHIDMSYNYINNASQVTMALTPHRQSLASLYLYHNSLGAFPDLEHMTSLKVLNLGVCAIRVLGSVPLPNTLSSLYLEGNYLTEIPLEWSTFSNLTYLDLSLNSIKSIDSFIFPSSLFNFNLKSNSIENISSILVSQNKTDITYLKLDFNPLKHIADDAFQHIPNLVHLDLDYTDLPRLPLALRSLTSLADLGLAHIRPLICTCREAALGPWYRAMTSLRVDFDSTCGGVDVTYFLGHLAQECPPPTQTS